MAGHPLARHWRHQGCREGVCDRQCASALPGPARGPFGPPCPCLPCRTAVLLRQVAAATSWALPASLPIRVWPKEKQVIMTQCSLAMRQPGGCALHHHAPGHGPRHPDMTMMHCSLPAFWVHPATLSCRVWSKKLALDLCCEPVKQCKALWVDPASFAIRIWPKKPVGTFHMLYRDRLRVQTGP